MDWHCIVCKKIIPIDGSDGSDGTLLPNVEGGTISIHFGWPSQFDLLGLELQHDEVHYQGAICDSCFAERKELTRLVKVERSAKFITLSHPEPRQSRADLNSDYS